MSIRSRVKRALAPADDRQVDWLLSAPFVAIHLALFAIPWLAIGAHELAFAGTTYAVGMFFVTAGYHRYFAHRAFRTSRVAQFVFALGAACTIQRGVLWWAGHHRHHHDRSDEPGDVHSPRDGWFWSHVKWILCNRYDEAPIDRISDFARFPELRALERFAWLPPLLLIVATGSIGGASLLVGGYLLGIVVLWHATFTINSLAHLWGRRDYDTADDSRNNALLALITFGEGWHNNHHHYPSAAAQGFRWWQFDLTYLLLRALSSVGIVWDLRPVPRRVRDDTRIRSEARREDRSWKAA